MSKRKDGGWQQAGGIMESKNENVKVPLISKIAYGFGDVGCNFSWMFVSNFLMIFYTDVFGISMAAVSALMLFSRFWDAINDPIVGGLTDKTKTKWGRYRPWLLIAAPITAVLLIMTFWAHPDWSDRSKVIYMVITYCLLVLGYTCVNIPYGTLCGAMTQDIDERAKINTSRSVSAMVAIGIINIITVPLIGKLGSQSAKTGYLLVAIMYGCIFAACHFFCFAKTKEQVIMPEKEKISIKVQLRAVMQNRPYILALIGQVLFGFTLYGRNADVLYYFTYVEGNASYYTTYSMCIIIPSIIGAACFQPVFRKLNNKGQNNTDQTNHTIPPVNSKKNDDQNKRRDQRGHKIRELVSDEFLNAFDVFVHDLSHFAAAQGQMIPKGNLHDVVGKGHLQFIKRSKRRNVGTQQGKEVKYEVPQNSGQGQPAPG